MLNKEKLETLLNLFGKLLEEKGEKLSLIICGGSALILSHFIKNRTVTRDIDILATVEEKSDTFTLKPLPFFAEKIIQEIASTLKLPSDWLNSRAFPLTKDLPEGFQKRLIRKEYGKNLTVYLLGRKDQIFFKLYATIDQGPGKHFDDLMELNPTKEELYEASLWCMRQDTSIEFKNVLKDFLEKIGLNDVAQQL